MVLLPRIFCFGCRCCRGRKYPKNKISPFICICSVTAVLFRLKTWRKDKSRKLRNFLFFLSLLYFALEIMFLQHNLWLAGWGSAHFRYRSLPDVQRVQLLLVSASIPSCIHLITNNTQDCTAQALERKRSFVKGFLKTVRKRSIFCSLVKRILPLVINITAVSTVIRAGLRAPGRDHFYFMNSKRREYCNMKNFTEVVNSEDFRESSIHFASPKSCSFLELPLIYTWGTEGRSSRSCLWKLSWLSHLKWKNGHDSH